MWLEYTWILVYRWGWNDENQPRRHQSQLWWAYQQHCFWPRGCGRRGCLLNLLLQPVGGARDDGWCLFENGISKVSMGYQCVSSFSSQRRVNCIGGQELLNNSWKGSTWISQLNPEVLRSEVEMWRSSCWAVRAITTRVWWHTPPPRGRTGRSDCENVATVRIFWDRISGSFQRESDDFMAVNLGIPNVQTNEDKASWSLVLECSW